MPSLAWATASMNHCWIAGSSCSCCWHGVSHKRCSSYGAPWTEFSQPIILPHHAFRLHIYRQMLPDINSSYPIENLPPVLNMPTSSLLLFIHVADDYKVSRALSASHQHVNRHWSTSGVNNNSGMRTIIKLHLAWNVFPETATYPSIQTLVNSLHHGAIINFVSWHSHCKPDLRNRAAGLAARLSPILLRQQQEDQRLLDEEADMERFLSQGMGPSDIMDDKHEAGPLHFFWAACTHQSCSACPLLVEDIEFQNAPERLKDTVIHWPHISTSYSRKNEGHVHATRCRCSGVNGKSSKRYG